MPSRPVSRTVRVILFLIFSTLLLCSLAALADQPPGKGKRGGNDREIGLSASINVGISVGDARQIATRYDLIGAKPLPPGIAKNLARGKPLPPGIAKTRLPGPFIADLPHHEGYEWQRVGRDLVLVAVGTLIVAEILERVFD